LQTSKTTDTLKYNTVDANVNRTLSRIEEVEEEDNASYQLRMSHLKTPGTPHQQITDKSIDEISP
jgi:hypothetical protein